MDCPKSIPSLSSSQLAALGTNSLLQPFAFYYLWDLGRVAVADSVATYHMLADDGAGVEAIPALSGSYVCGQGRQFSGSATFTPIAGRLYGVSFTQRSVFAGYGGKVLTAGSSDAVARVGEYERASGGQADALVAEIGEFAMNAAGQVDFPYPASLSVDYARYLGIVFGGTAMPVLAGHIASSEEGARIWGASDCAGPNPPVTGIYVDLGGGYPAAMPDPFPTPYNAVGVGLGVCAKVA